MSESMWFFLISSILALFLFVLTLWYQRRDKAREKVIETEIIQTELINPEISSLMPVYTIVKRSRVSVTSAYKYIINAKNIGLSAIEKPEIEISFDAKAHIHEINPDSKHLTHDKIDISLGIQSSNYCRVIPEYMNKGHALTIVIITLNNRLYRK